jgi:hypothetical protein
MCIELREHTGRGIYYLLLLPSIAAKVQEKPSSDATESVRLLTTWPELLSYEDVAIITHSPVSVCK